MYLDPLPGKKEHRVDGNIGIDVVHAASGKESDHGPLFHAFGRCNGLWQTTSEKGIGNKRDVSAPPETAHEFREVADLAVQVGFGQEALDIGCQPYQQTKEPPSGKEALKNQPFREAETLVGRIVCPCSHDDLVHRYMGRTIDNTGLADQAGFQLFEEITCKSQSALQRLLDQSDLTPRNTAFFMDFAIDGAGERTETGVDPVSWTL